MTSRTRKRSLAGLALVGALALSGCSLHPGQAAVVDGSDISQSRVDDLVLAACSFTKATREQGGAASGASTPNTAMAYLRHVLLQDLISFRITDKAATQMHLTVSPASIAKITSSQTIPPGVSDSDARLLTQFFDDSARSQLQQAVIGAHIKDPSVTTADSVTPNDVKAAQKYLTAFTEKQDVDVSPSFGTWDGQVLVDGDGSVSVPESAAALTWVNLRKTNATKVDGLPPGQVCG